MTKFDRWFQEYKSGRSNHEWIEASKPHLEKAWNAALNELSEALEIHDTLGDIKYEVNKRLRTDD